MGIQDVIKAAINEGGDLVGDVRKANHYDQQRVRPVHLSAIMAQAGCPAFTGCQAAMQALEAVGCMALGSWWVGVPV